MITGPPAVIEKPRPNPCPGAPDFVPAHGLTSDQLDVAHQEHIRELRRIIACYQAMTAPSH